MEGKDRSTAPVRASSSLQARNMARQLRKRKWSVEQAMRAEMEQLKSNTASFDPGFWDRLLDIDERFLEAANLGRKASMFDLEYIEDANPSHEQAWEATEDGRRICEIEAMLQRRLAYLQKLKIFFFSATPSTVVQSSVAMFIASARFGMDPPNTSPRPEALQNQFIEELVEVMGSRHPAPDMDEWFWCPIQATYIHGTEDNQGMLASHLFPAGATQLTMDAIFGPQEQFKWRNQETTQEPGVRGELFRACNGIYLSAEALSRFGRGYFVIVPDLEVDCTKAQARAWQESAVKEYRVRVIRPDAPAMQKSMGPYNPRTWGNVDGTRVMWGDPGRREKSTFRPCARYLYWNYLTALLRNVHGKGRGGATKGGRQGLATSADMGQIGRKYWGSAGAYVKKDMLRGFLEEVGHEYDEELTEAAMDPGSEDEPAELAVMTAIEDILCKNAAAEELYDDDNDDDDDDDDE